MKTLQEIYDGMRLDFVRRTGASAADECDLAARMYALAAQIYALQVQGEWVRKQCFPQTARGEYLDRHAAMRGLSRKPAAYAVGEVRFSMDVAVNYVRGISVGTVVMTEDGMRFQTTKVGLIGAGEMWVDVPVRAEEPGTAGNIPAGAITRFAVAPVSAITCANLEGFQGGAEEEGDEDLRARVLESFRNLPNGANAAYYRQLVLSDEEAVKAVVVPRPRGVGSVDVVVSTRSGGLDYSTQQRLQKLVNEQRELAVDVKIKAPDLRRLKLEVEVAPAAGYDTREVLDRVRTALTGFFTGELLGEKVPLVKLGSVIYGCEGVENYRILSPTADVAAEETVLPEIATLTVEEMI